MAAAGVAGEELAKEEAAKKDSEMEVAAAVKAAMLRVAVVTRVAVWEVVATVVAKEGGMEAVMEAVVVKGSGVVEAEVTT